MSAIVVQSGLATAALAADWRIPRDQVIACHSAEALLAFARTEVAEIDARCVKARADAEQRGFEEGVRRARLEIEATTAAQLAALQEQTRSFYQNLEQRLGALALAVVRRLVGDVGEDRMIERLAARTLEEILDEAPHAIRVSLNAAPRVAERLGPLHPHLRIVPDAALASDACVFETEGGRVDASLTLQLDAMLEAFCTASVMEQRVV